MYLRIGAVTLWVIAAALLAGTVHKFGWQHGNAAAWPCVLLLIGRMAWDKATQPKG